MDAFCFRQIFINPVTNQTRQEGELYKRQNLANTLERIGRNGLEEFYTGNTAKTLIDELQKRNSILTLEDLQNYRYTLAIKKWAPKQNFFIILSVCHLQLLMSLCSISTIKAYLGFRCKRKITRQENGS